MHKFISVAIVLIIFFACGKKTGPANQTIRNPGTALKKKEIRDGKFYLNDKWVYLKIAKPLGNMADPNFINALIGKLDIMKAKNYNTIELNCYWHHFDPNGDGIPDVSLKPLNDLIYSIYARGMNPCLSVETYAVGGGTIPEGFWTKYPEAQAIDDRGEKVSDNEYNTGAKVVSIFHDEYKKASRNFIKNLARGLDTKKILWFETTVEPQYMGNRNLCYSPSARTEYNKWLTNNNIPDAASQMPTTFPIPSSFINNPNWNKFRAQYLAGWINGDAKAYKEIAGANAYIAVDYLDAAENTMQNRVGDPQEFLNYITEADIIQVNWSWYFPTNTPNQKAYDRVNLAKKTHNREWAISEHMTFNGSDFTIFSDDQLNNILMNTITQGTGLGWEFVSVENYSAGNFSMYNDDWTPKRPMAAVDNRWDYWLQMVKKLK